MSKQRYVRYLIGLAAFVCLGSLLTHPALAQGLKLKGEVKLEEAWNPRPDEDDLELPMPCGARMIFKAVCIQSKGFLWDMDARLGCDQCDRSEREYYERKYAGAISGPFTPEDFPEAWRKKLAGKGLESPHCYLIGKYEVTQLQWRAIMEDRCPGPSDPLTAQDALPKTEVTWYEAIEFTRRYTSWLLKEAAGSLPKFPGDGKNIGVVRLPTEAEWEYAARGGHRATLEGLRQEEFFERDKTLPLTQFAVFRPEGAAKIEERPQRIGSRAPNPLGIYDTAGNVAEMVFDAFRFSLGGRLHGAAGGFVRKGGGYLSGQGEIMPGRREEVAFFQLDGPTKARDLGFRAAISGINTPGGARPGILQAEWRKAGEEYNLVLDQSKNPVDEIDRLLKGTKSDTERQNLAHIRNILKDNNIALERQRKAAAEGLIRSSVYAIETTRNYAIRRLVAKLQLNNMEAEKKNTAGRKVDFDFDKAIRETQEGVKLLDEAVEASLAYYRSKIGECLNYPKEILDSQFKVVQADYLQSNRFAQTLQKQLELYRKHTELLRKNKGQLPSADLLRKDILEDRYK